MLYKKTYFAQNREEFGTVAAAAGANKDGVIGVCGNIVDLVRVCVSGRNRQL